MITQEKILDSLRHIIDPDLNRDIVSLGFVKNINISDGAVAFDIELTTPACPVKAHFQAEAEKSVKALAGVQSVTVKMTSQVPQRKTGSPQDFKSTLDKVGAIIAVSSCKGGVGKSTVAAHMAQELAGRGHKVGLVDTDLHGPSVPTLFNLQGSQVYSTQEKLIQPIEKNDLKIMSFGFLLGEKPAVMRGPMVSRYIQQILHTTDWGDLDYLFIDMPPGTGDVQLTITQTCRLNGAVIVTTPQTLSLIDVTRGILMFEQVNVPILGIIENMAYFTCDACDKKHFPFGEADESILTKRFGVETLAQLPILPQFSHSIDTPISNEFFMTAVDKTIMALGKLQIHETSVPAVTFDKQNVSLAWPDGDSLTVPNRELRLSCECALCVNEMTGKKTLQEHDVPADIQATDVTPLGNYAIGINWSDGHTSGIYPYKRIKELAGIKS